MDPTVLPIVADTPSRNPRLGFETYARALAEAVCGGRPAQFTVGIYGPWGSGKSSLLFSVAEHLRRRVGVQTVLFDAWRYERSEHIIVPLLYRIHEVAQSTTASAEVRSRLKDALLSVVRSVTFSLGPVSVNLDNPVAGRDHLSDQQKLEQLDAAYLRPFNDMRAISEALGDQRVVVLIDDLDRCSPGNVVALLEAINLVLDVPGFVFVLALDYDVLVNAVNVKYPHVSGHVFIEKMIQVPFRVPRLDLTQATFLDDLVPGWATEHGPSLPADFPEMAYEVATFGLNANPRQIKRFINSTLVLLRVAQDIAPSIDARLLAGVVGLQLRWPPEYQDFADAVFNDDATPVTSLTRSDEPELQRYAGRFFREDQTAGDLRTVLNLTRAIGPTEAATEYASSAYGATPNVSAAALREVNRDVLVVELNGAGFAQTRPNSQAYYHPDAPGVRIKLGKTMVRMEARDQDGEWRLGRSLLLTRQDAEARELISDLPRLDREIRAGAEAAGYHFSGESEA